MDAERLFTQTKQGFGFYHKHFGLPYAFGKYDQLFVPEFNAGAMENAGAVTFLEDYVFRSKVTRASYERRAETVLHEMAHMWFGDLVTMRWWDDLWLNESFATWAGFGVAASEPPAFTGAWTTLAPCPQKAGAYVAGPASPPRIRWSRTSWTSRRPSRELRRDHLCQGRVRCSSNSSRTSATTPSWPG